MIIYIYITYRESGQILSSKRGKNCRLFCRQLMFIVGEVSESFETMERLSLSNDFLRLSFPWERVKKETIPTILLFVVYRNDVSFMFLFFSFFFFIGKRYRMNHNNNVVVIFFLSNIQRIPVYRESSRVREPKELYF